MLGLMRAGLPREQEAAVSNQEGCHMEGGQTCFVGPGELSNYN